MNAVGVDVSKSKSVVAVRRPLNEIVAKSFEVRHTGSELKQLADYLKSLEGEMRVIVEHTGRYYESIAQYLHDAGLYVSAVNPKLIKDSGSGNTLRRAKTDKADEDCEIWPCQLGRSAGIYPHGHDSLSIESTEPAVRPVYQNKDGNEK